MAFIVAVIISLVSKGGGLTKWLKVSTGVLALIVLAGYLVMIYQMKGINNNTQYHGVFVNTEVDQLIKESCFDCHSNQTEWPWYTYVPLVGNVVVWDVVNGRDALNYSNWESFSPRKQRLILEDTIEVMARGTMPLKIYTAIHADLKISAEQKDFIENEIKKKFVQQD